VKLIVGWRSKAAQIDRKDIAGTGATPQLENTYRSRFIFIAMIFDLLELNLHWQNNYRTKVEKKFFFIVTSSYVKMSYLGPKKLKNSRKRVKFFLQIGRYEYQKSEIFC
jgi:hypothetical protein